MMKNEELGAGIVSVITAAMARAGWGRDDRADDVRAEAVAECWRVYRVRRPENPLAYFRKIAPKILARAAKALESGGVSFEDLPEFGREDLRAKAREELQARIAELDKHIADGRALRRSLERIKKAL